MNDHVHHRGDPGHHIDFDSPSAAGYAELEGEVLDGLMTQAVAALAELCARRVVDVRRVLDLGCGPGVGSCYLAQRFGSASVVAVDSSVTMLEHVKARADRLGLGRRVQTRLVDLNAGLGSVGAGDIVWASLVLHHLGDEAAALGRIRGVLESGGMLALLERASPARILFAEGDPGRPGFWDRLEAAGEAWFTGMRADLPEAKPSADYPTMLREAGFEVLTDEVLTLVLDAPLDGRARRFAHEHLARVRARLAHDVDAADLEVLDVLTDENADEGIMRRDDATICASRHLYVAAAVS